MINGCYFVPLFSLFYFVVLFVMFRYSRTFLLSVFFPFCACCSCGHQQSCFGLFWLRLCCCCCHHPVPCETSVRFFRQHMLLVSLLLVSSRLDRGRSIIFFFTAFGNSRMREGGTRNRTRSRLSSCSTFRAWTFPKNSNDAHIKNYQKFYRTLEVKLSVSNNALLVETSESQGRSQEWLEQKTANRRGHSFFVFVQRTCKTGAAFYL